MLVNKVIRVGYYWPTMNKDAANLVRTCGACQRFAREESPIVSALDHLAMAIC